MNRKTLAKFTIAGIGAGGDYEVEDDGTGNCESVTLYEVHGSMRYGRLAAPTFLALVEKLRGILHGLGIFERAK